MPLNLCTAETKEWSDKFIPLEMLYVFDQENHRARDSIARNRPYAHPQFNTIYWPSGASRFAHAYFVVTKAVVGALRQTVGNGETFQEATSKTLQIGDPRLESDSRFVKLNMRMLTPIPLQVNGPENWLFVLPLVDDRWFWRRYSGKTVLTPWLENGSEPALSTWVSLLNSLNQIGGQPGSPIGNNITAGVIDSAYLKPDLLVSAIHPSDGESLIKSRTDMIDQICLNTGLGVIKQFQGLLSYQNWTQAFTHHQSNIDNLPRLAGYDATHTDVYPDSAALAFPEQIEIQFPKVNSVTGWYTGEYQGFRSSQGQMASDLLGHSNELWVFWDTCKYDTRNFARLDALVQRFAADLVLRLRHQGDVVFSGICNVEPSALYDTIEWHYREGCCYTRCRILPPDFGPWQLQHQDDTVPPPLGDYEEATADDDFDQDAPGSCTLNVADSRRSSNVISPVVCPFIDVNEDDILGIHYHPTLGWRVIAKNC